MSGCGRLSSSVIGEFKRSSNSSPRVALRSSWSCAVSLRKSVTFSLVSSLRVEVFEELVEVCHVIAVKGIFILVGGRLELLESGPIDGVAFLDVLV